MLEELDKQQHKKITKENACIHSITNITNFSRDLKLGVKITFRPSKTRNIVGIYCI